MQKPGPAGTMRKLKLTGECVMPTTAIDCWKAGDVTGAVNAALAAVREEPTDRPARHTLAEMLLFAGDLDRADKHYDYLVTHADPTEMLRLLMMRQLLRAEQTRREVFTQGRAPGFLTDPTPAMKPTLEALMALREGFPGAAQASLAEAEQLRTATPGTADGIPFADFRDLDDITAGVLEILSAKGTYFWVPFEQIRQVTFEPPALRTDLLWRRAKLVTTDGTEGDICIPVTYPGSQTDSDDPIRLGRRTDYRGNDGEPIRGAGMREFLFGEEPKSIMELTDLRFGA
ncbi:MAG: type VI secretion system accessory protein TagJ [Gemmataceae bacterium]